MQRYHATLHLPVHRIKYGNERSRVFAYRKDLDRWMRQHVPQEIAAGMDKQLAATKEIRDKLSAIQQRVQLSRNVKHGNNPPRVGGDLSKFDNTDSGSCVPIWMQV